MSQFRYLVTGGAGFIGSAVVRQLVARGCPVLVFDKLTYSGNLESLRDVRERIEFLEADIRNAAAVRGALERFRPDIVMNLAAESHVDRSIDGPAEFVQTNVVGTFVLLDESLRHWRALEAPARERFRFHHVSTDEVFGSLGVDDEAFRETTPYAPTSPYSASKAASDHLVRAWGHTYDLPVVLSNCSNNYGPYHFPEKLIPLTILNALEGQPLPVYGTGQNIRDWLFVEDHAEALIAVAERGRVGESYNIGGRAERSNLDVVTGICTILDELTPNASIGERAGLITFVADRPGHDLRYAIEATKIETELGWRPQETFETGLRRTVQWFLDNDWWWRPLRTERYGGKRLGLAAGRGSK